MKRTHYLAGLMLSIALFSCSDEQLAGTDGGKQKEAKEQPKVEISVDAENAVIGLPGKAPMTRGNETITTNPNKPDDVTGYLKYVSNHRITTDLIIGMQVGDNGTKCFFHLVRDCPIKQEGDQFFLELMGSYKTTPDATTGTLAVSSNYRDFKNEYQRRPNELRAYVAAVVGGKFDKNNLISKYNPTNLNPEGNVTYDYNKHSPLLPDAEWKKNGKANNNIVFISRRNEKNGDYSVDLDIPLTTKRWRELGQNRINLKPSEDKWEIDLSDIRLELAARGHIMALVYKNTELAEPNEKTGIRTTPVEAWIDGLRIKKMDNNSTISYPITADVNVSNTDWSGEIGIHTETDLVGWGDRDYANPWRRIFINGVYSGKMEPDGWSHPIYLWGYGRGKVEFTFNLTKRKNTTEDDLVAYFEAFVIVKKDGQEYGHCYFPTDEYCTQFIQDFSSLEEGKSYTCHFNPTEKDGEGLIISEMFVNNAKGENYENKSMVEIYNPTNHSIDLRNYGLIRFVNFSSYLGDNGGPDMGDMTTKGQTGFYTHIENAKVQKLYVMDPFKEGEVGARCYPVYRYNHTIYRNTITNKFYDRLPYENNTVRYAPYLGPKQTCILTGGFNIDVNTGGNTKVELERKGLAPLGDYSLGDKINKSIKNAITEQYTCQFICALDDGEVKSMGYGGQTGVLNTGWAPWVKDYPDIYQRLCGFALVRLNSENNWQMVDVLGPTSQEDENLLRDYHNARDIAAKRKCYKKYFGIDCEVDGHKIFGFNKLNYRICIIRNNRPGDDKQTLNFLKVENGELKPKMGTNPNTDLWLVYPINASNGDEYALPDRFPAVNYRPSLGKRFSNN